MDVQLPGSHSLLYDFTAVSESSSGQPSVTALGYLDGQHFVAYDSKSRSARLRGPQPAGRELAQLLAAKETALLADRLQEVAWGLKTLVGYSKLSRSNGSLPTDEPALGESRL
ncbi:H-2 class I histocompatibility antigen, TLA(B) alpha chain-like [Trichechus inunguis]